MVGNPQRCRVAARQLDNRHATAGCLLGLLLVLPCAADRLSTTTIAVATLFYVGVAVPLAAGYITLKTLIGKLRTLVKIESLRYWLRQVKIILLWSHNTFYHLDSIQNTTNQILFFLACEKLLCPDQRLSCLYVLLFFTVIAYLKKSLQTRQWTVLMHETNTANFLKLTTTFIIVRLGKAVALSLVLLTFTLQFNHLEPTMGFVIVTALYFVLTQFKVNPGEDKPVISLIRRLELQILEGFEDYWVPFLVPATAVAMSACVCLAVWHHYVIFFSVGYSNVYVSWKKTLEKFWEPLQCQRAIVAQFSRATARQMEAHGDYTCAVCLDEMRPLMCRVTPCGHIFHSQCLHRCVLQFGQCPLCKQPI